MISHYYDRAAIEAQVKAGRHREIVGGLWEEIGQLQMNFLRSWGLKPSDRILDIGCGSLRAGVKLVEYLDVGNYFGTDINQSLLDAGYDLELKHVGLEHKLPRDHLICDGDFQFSRLPGSFRFALAQSLFTHLPANHIQLCLARLAPSVEPNGVFFATFFIVPDDHPIGAPFTHQHGVKTFDNRDPFHYRSWQIAGLCDHLPWYFELIGDWSHPRDQQMVIFRRSARVTSNTRALNTSEANDLPAGADHYRAFVGPPRRYDFISSSQFSLLFALGLRENHKVLDFGCGSLRLGRLLIPFLRPERYFAIEPNRWLIEEGIEKELGRDAVRIKRPAFSFNDDFCCGAFGTSFDYIVAQSILTHCGIDLARSLLGEFSSVLASTGLIAFSVVESNVIDETPPTPGWTYPNCVSYGVSTLAKLCTEANLTCRRIPWYHPGATWYIAAHKSECLPPEEDMQLLRGAVLGISSVGL